jgi:peptidoglycan/xylan/chitin deacetylase (PgdA/CDA1 family)
MKRIILTIDDRLLFNYTNIFPILNHYGFKATFFFTAKRDIWKDIRGWEDMSREHLLEIYHNGHEIGNHTFGHFPITHGVEHFEGEIKLLDSFFDQVEIKQPVSFAYPGYCFIEEHKKQGAEILKRLGYKFARMGYPEDKGHYNIGNRDAAVYFNPATDNPYQICSTGVINDQYTIEKFMEDADGIPENSYGIFTTHYVESKQDINRLHQICQFIRSRPDMKMVRMCDIGQIR